MGKEQPYLDLFQNMDNPILVIDSNGNCIDANLTALELFECSLKELLTKNVTSFHPPDIDLTEKEYKSLWENGGIIEIPHLIHGKKKFVQFTITSTNWNGKPVSIGVGIDITEQKKINEALKDSEYRFRNLSEVISDWVWETDTNGVYTYSNLKVTDLLGYKVQEVIGKSPFEFIIMEEASHKSIQFQDKTKDKQPFTGFESTYLHKNGQHIVLDTSGMPVFNSLDQFLGYRGISRDITERKSMETKILRAAEEWRRTFDSITDWVSIVDKDFKLTRVNMAFANTFKKRPQDLIGKHCYEIVHKTNEPIPDCPHRKTLKTGKSSTEEYLEPSLGMYLEVTISPMFDANGEYTGSIHVARDTNERRRMQEQLMLTDRLASIGELASGIAHEVNNPLTGVIGFSQLLLDKDLPNDAKDYLNLINSEATRCAGIISNLLTFARKHKPVKKLCQIHDVIEAVLKLREYEHNLNNIKIVRKFDPDLPEVTIDFHQMQQVFLNIIVNAEYFMIQEHHKGTLTITTKKLKKTVRISVADDGPGIRKENLNQLFNPFFTTKEVGKGTGLGLSICHGIMSEHGGKIYAKSQYRKGATFIVELPVTGKEMQTDNSIVV